MDYTLKQVTGRLSKALACVHEGDFDKATEDTRAALAALEGLKRRTLAEPSDFQTPTPIGFETTIGYVFGHSPAVATLITDISIFVDVDEPILAERALKQGHPVCTVEAPRALRDRGIKSCLAFPEAVLREHYNV